MRTVILLLLFLSVTLCEPSCVSKKKGNDGVADCMAAFVQTQIQKRDGLAATYKNARANLSKRADVYDSALSLILLIENEKSTEAKDLADALVNIVEQDGRSRTAYSTSGIFEIEDKSVNLGSMSFQIIALSRFYLNNRNYKYLKAAINLGNFIRSHLLDIDTGGYFGGYSPNGIKYTWRAVEQNIALYAAARLLYSITNGKEWQQVMNNAATFIRHSWENHQGRYAISINGR
jgi:hypothetical protein